MPNNRLSYLRGKSMRLPLAPGVYIMKNSDGEIIYIGKAKLLKNRVSQYFGSQNNHTVKVCKMVENVYDFEHILTASEFEALVLECSLIKQYKPKYNILLKDDKGYSYIKITNEPWRKLKSAKQKIDDGSKYIGPYMSGFVVKESLDAALKIFKLPQCNKTFPCGGKNNRPCLNYHMNQCLAPCTGRVKKADYDAAVDDAIDFLKGDTKEYLKTLGTRMESYSENLEFEKAAEMRDRISAIKRLSDKQKVLLCGTETKDVFALARDEDIVCFNVLRFVDGKLSQSENHFTDISDSLSATRADFIKRFYIAHDDIPGLVFTDGECDDSELIEQWLGDRLGKKVTITIPEKGKQAEVVSMSKSNAYEAIAEKRHRKKSNAAVIELGETLGLGKIPEFIESYDISHTAGADSVGGMVVFKNGEPYKSGYRKFIIKDALGGDDYGSMREVLTRRFEHYFKDREAGKEDGFARLPDLILMDGGQGQVNVALEVLNMYNLDIPVFGMVKDGKHRTRAISHDGGEISINGKRKVFTLVSGIQEEVHRFAIGYHHQKHSKSSKTSELTKIPGIGPKKAEALWKKFRTIDAMKRADIDELADTPGLGIADAVHIKAFFAD